MESPALRLLLLSFLLVSTRSQVTYPTDFTSVLRELSDEGLSQDQLASALHQGLDHVTTSNLLAGLRGVLQGEQRDSDPALRFQSEASAGASIRASTGSQCTLDIEAYIRHVDELQWAQRMLDATGKPGAGLMSGSFMFLGDFDQCRDVQASYTSVDETSVTQEHQFKGQYCLGKYTTSLVKLPDQLRTDWAFCIPDSCTERDALELVNRTLSQLNVTALEFKSMTCNLRDVPFTGRAVGVFVMVAVILVFVLLGTAVDVLMVQMPKWRVNVKVQEDLGSLPPNAPTEAAAGRRGDWQRRIEADPVLVNSDNAPPVTVQARRQPLLVRILVTFSAWTNTQKLLNTSQPPGSLTCLNGLRVISINWVVLGHTVLLLSRNGNNVVAYLQEALKRWPFQAIVNATPSVDTFFVLSGVLVAYITLNQMKKTGGKVNWLMFYVHRYLRLTPIYMIVMGLYLGTLPYLINGPLYDQKNGFEPDPHCRNNWWGNPLYIQNLVRFRPHFCMGWSWYLAVDMQFYILSPLLLIPFYHRPRLGYLVAALFLITTTLTPLVLSETRKYASGNLVIQLKGHPKPKGEVFYDIYIAPYSRMGPYLVGLLLGHALSRINRRPVEIQKSLVVLGWAAALATGLAVVYGLLPYFKGGDMDLHLASVYNAVSRTAWALSVAWVIFACVTGHGGVINTFLSWSLWVPLARLTYVVYLVHIVVMDVWIVTGRTPLYASDYTVAMLYIAVLTVTYAVALIISVVFEAPGLALEKMMFARGKKQ